MVYRYKHIFMLLFVSLAVSNFTGCFYSFTGASVAPHLKTIAIPVFEDRSGSAVPNLRNDFTNKLIQRFIEDNTLQVAERRNADALLEGTILSLQDNNAVISSGERLTRKEVVITVRVVYRDLVLKKVVSEKNYSYNANYELGGDVIGNRQAAIRTAIDRITDDILIGTVSNW